MTKINMKRLLLGGLVAGVILFILTGVVNACFLKSEFEVWSQSMGLIIHPPEQSISMILWTLMSFIYGFVGVWIYVCIRPRFGGGAKTALLAGFILWFVSKLATSLDLIALGIFSEKFIVGQVTGSFIAFLLAILCGSWMYRE